ncbi:protein dispatched homolog 1 [Clonorchis sinensis]|uniref:Protein dispatched homolog 1 n=1 Tax=Clonorchis sinensis TaxID=79923 RepID=G7Y3R0_CLOSI|nr:protein dispatched homolog 1 [Clonorchis sinensis]
MQSEVCMVLSPFPVDSHPTAQNQTVVPNADSRSLLLRFSQCVVRYRVLFGVCSFAFLVASAVTAAFTCHLPDLSDPSADFVAIRTDWSANVQQFKALLSETRSYPWLAGSSLARRHGRGSGQQMQRWSIKQLDRVTTLPLFKHQGRFTGYGSQEEQLNLCFGEHSSVIEANNLWTTYEGYGRLVISLDQNPSLNAPNIDVGEVPLNFFTEPGAFESLCSFQSRIYELDVFKQECVHSVHPRPARNTTSNQPHCCSAWSVPNMVAALLGRSSCSQIRDSELVEIDQLLTSCLPAFRNNTLRRVCWDAYGSDPTLLCPLVTPASCLQSPLIPLILATSLPDATDWRWRTTLIQLPVRRADSLSLFLALEAVYRSGNLTSDLPVPVYIQGMYLHAYNELVSETIFRDTCWLVIGLGTLLVLLALGTGTVVIPTITLIGIGWSLLAAYGLYSRVLCIPHFPVLNLMAVVLAIGLGADDLLVYFQVWKTSLRLTPLANSMNGDFESTTLSPWSKPRHSRSTGLNEPRADCSKFCGNGCFSFHNPSTSTGDSILAVRLQFTLHHAIPSMALTSIATALGLLINFLSSIVAVQRFALFSLLIFRLCLEEYTSFEHHILPREFQSGFRFPATHSGEPLGLIVSVLTNLSMLTSTHDELRRGVYDLSAWFLQALTTAPDHLRGGRLVFSTLGPFEVEKNLTEYVYWSILVAVLLAALLVLLSTGTLCLAVIALVSLFACLVTTVLLLIVVDNWSLGIVEGLVLSLAAGLAIDPCLHLALSVKRAGGRCCCDTGLGWTSRSVRTSMCMLNAAVTGSAGSTAIAGCCSERFILLPHVPLDDVPYHLSELIRHSSHVDFSPRYWKVLFDSSSELSPQLRYDLTYTARILPAAFTHTPFVNPARIRINPSTRVVMLPVETPASPYAESTFKSKSIMSEIPYTVTPPKRKSNSYPGKSTRQRRRNRPVEPKIVLQVIPIIHAFADLCFTGDHRRKSKSLTLGEILVEAKPGRDGHIQEVLVKTTSAGMLALLRDDGRKLRRCSRYPRCVGRYRIHVSVQQSTLLGLFQANRMQVIQNEFHNIHHYRGDRM